VQVLIQTLALLHILLSVGCLQVLLLIPVFILPAFLPSLPQRAHAARAAPTHTMEVWPANHGPIRQATTVSEGSEHRIGPTNSAHTSAVVVDHSNIHSNIRGGFVDDTPRGHSSPVAEVQQTFAESPSTRVAGLLSLLLLLLLLAPVSREASLHRPYARNAAVIVCIALMSLHLSKTTADACAEFVFACSVCELWRGATVPAEDHSPQTCCSIQ